MLCFRIAYFRDESENFHHHKEGSIYKYRRNSFQIIKFQFNNYYCKYYYCTFPHANFLISNYGLDNSLLYWRSPNCNLFRRIGTIPIKVNWNISELFLKKYCKRLKLSIVSQEIYISNKTSRYRCIRLCWSRQKCI